MADEAGIQTRCPRGKQRSRELARNLQDQHPDTVESVLEEIDEMFAITELGITGELAPCQATTNVIEPPSSGARRVSGWMELSRM